MASKEKCVSCHKVCNKDNLHCKMCGESCHPKCAGISDGTFKEIQSILNFSWNCDDCVNKFGGDVMGGVIGRIDGLGKKMNDLECECNSGNHRMDDKFTKMSDTFAGMIEKFDMLDKQVNKLMIDNDTILKNVTSNLGDKKINDSLSLLKKDIKSSWSDVVKAEVNRYVSKVDEGMDSLKKEVLKTKEKVELNCEIDDKAHNIIIFRLQETKELGYDEFRKIELDNILHILKTVTKEKIEKEDIDNFFRLGKKDGSTRPLLIKFKTKNTRNMLMDNLSNFGSLDGIFKNIFIGYDLTKSQREECKKLTMAGKEKTNSDNGEFIYRVRGKPGNFRLVKLRKRVS